MDAEKRKALEDLLGKDLAAEILSGIEATAEKAQQSGIRYKSTSQPVSEHYRSPDGRHWRYDTRLKEWHPAPATGIDPEFLKWALPGAAPRRAKQHARHPMIDLIGDMFAWENEQ
jgi:hypothetical protein